MANVTILVEAGAEIDAQDTRGWTALMYSIKAHYGDTVSYLVRQGARKDIESKDGETATTLAQTEGIKGTLLQK